MSSAPVTPEILRLPEPLRVHGALRYCVLSPAAFKQLVIDEGLSRDELRARGVPHNVFTASLVHYKTQYGAAWAALKSKRYARSKKGNTYGARCAPAVLLPEAAFKEVLDNGQTVPRIAEAFGVSAWLVRANMRYYGVKKEKELPARMQALDMGQIARLDALVPGFTSAAKAYYEEPELFFNKLYEIHGELLELSALTKELARGYSHFRTNNKVPRNHITWASNKHEMQLSRALLALGIAHVRQHVFPNRFIADFLLNNALVVEVDGSFHEHDANTKARDKKKNRFFQKAGLAVLRFSTKQVEEELPWVLQTIKTALSAK